MTDSIQLNITRRKPIRFEQPPYTPTRVVAETFPDRSASGYQISATVLDPYRWLETASDEEVQAWIGNQNGRTDRWFNEASQKTTHDEFATAMQSLYATGVSTGVPIPRGEKLFYEQREPNIPFPILYVQDNPASPPRKILDPNELKTKLMAFTPSGSGRYLACEFSPTGSDLHTISIIDVATGAFLKDTIAGKYPAFGAWHGDGEFFYVAGDPHAPEGADPKSNRRLFRHRLGEENDTIVFGEGRNANDMIYPHCFEDILIADVYIGAGAKSRDDVYYMDLSQADPKWVALLENQDGTQTGEDLFYSSTDRTIYVHTNKFPNNGFGVAAVSLDAPSTWRTVIYPPDPTGRESITGFALTGGKLYVRRLQNVRTTLSEYRLDGTLIRFIPFETGTSTVFACEVEDKHLFFNRTTFVQSEIYNLNTESGEVTLFSRLDFGTSFATDDIVTEQKWCDSGGVQVPMFIVYKKGMTRNGKNKVFLNVYGGFDEAVLPALDRTLIPGLLKGRIYVIANIRGGNEFPGWADAGKRERKQNSVDDTIATAEFLIAQGYTEKGLIALGGWSHGGFVTLAAVNQRPDLFGAAVVGKPVTDATRDDAFSGRARWRAEFGSIKEPEMVGPMLAISPFHNIGNQDYCPIYVVEGGVDDRINGGDGRKAAAMLQAYSQNLVLLRVWPNQGHSNDALSEEQRIAVFSEVWCFIDSVITLDNTNN